MPQSYEPEDNRPEVQNKSKMAEGGPPQSGSEQTKTKKPRKPRQTKQQKLQVILWVRGHLMRRLCYPRVVSTRRDSSF
jgi:hypothetical protein